MSNTLPFYLRLKLRLESIYVTMKVTDRSLRFVAGVQHNPASSKVSTDSSGNKHTYAAEAKQEDGCRGEDSIL